MTERLKVKVAVFLILEKDGKYLFSQRMNTGYRDGFYTFPSGHVDIGEKPLTALVREAKEEILIDINESDLQFVHALFERDNYADYYFKVKKWIGEPINGEPEKCGEIKWTTVAELEGKIVEKVQGALKEIEKGVLFSEIDRTD